MSNWVDYYKLKLYPLPPTIEKLWFNSSSQKLLKNQLNDKLALEKLVRNGLEYDKNYAQAQLRAYGAVIPIAPIPPSFGGRIKYSNSLALTSDGSLVVDHILCIVAHQFPNIEDCPMLPAVCNLLAHFYESPDDLLGVILTILRINTGRDDNSKKPLWSFKSNENHKEFYFPASNKEFLMISRAFGNLIYKSNRKLYNHVKNLHQSSDKPFWHKWISDFYIDIIPQCLLWRLLDCFILDGYRALLRFGLGILTMFKDRILEIDTLSEFEQLFTEKSAIFSSNEVYEDIFKFYSKITIQTLDTSNSIDHHPSLLHISSEDLTTFSTQRYQRGLPKFISTETTEVRKKSNEKLDLLSTSTVTQSDYWIALWSWIPPQKRLDSIELVFTTREHGTSISTLFNLTLGFSPMILIIETLEGSIFGVYLSQPWNVDSSSEFYGNGENFMFTLKPFAKLYPWAGRLDSDLNQSNNQQSDNITSYGTNLFVSTTHESLIVGGGGSGFGLSLNDMLLKGETDYCKTFGNDPLTGTKSKTFDILTCEVFVFRED